MAILQAVDDTRMRRAELSTIGARAISARFDKRRRKLVLRLDGGLDIAFDPRRVPGLESVADGDLADVEIVGVGSTIHLPRLDADYGVASLLDLFLKPGMAQSSARVASPFEPV